MPGGVPGSQGGVPVPSGNGHAPPKPLPSGEPSDFQLRQFINRSLAELAKQTAEVVADIERLKGPLPALPPPPEGPSATRIFLRTLAEELRILGGIAGVGLLAKLAANVVEEEIELGDALADLQAADTQNAILKIELEIAQLNSQIREQARQRRAQNLPAGDP